ncbi:Adenomatous polyposis coli protein, partial [Acropora cervicornis]
DIFDRNIDQLDVRETPRWELSEEESGGSDVETLVNQQSAKKKSAVSRQEIQPVNIPPVGSPRGTHEMQNRHIAHATQVPPMQNPMLKTEVPLPNSSKKSTSGSNAGPSPKLFRHPMDKGKIDSLVESAEREKSPDSAKDFSASKLQGQPGLVQLTNGQPKSSREQQGKSDINVWGEDDVDSVKDFTGNDRKKEEKYMERTDEVIYQRAAEEHIRRPPLWHDEEVDSVRNYSRTTGKQEPQSGLASQQLSRLPSDEHICLSPPWNDEDDGLVEDFAAQYRKTRSMENSRRPSEENIYLTPPWMEDEQQSSGVNHSASSRSYRLTLGGRRAIREEARGTGMPQAGDTAQAMRKEKKAAETAGPSGVGSVVAGSNSKFSSDQGQLVAAHHQSQGQVQRPAGLPGEKETQGEPHLPSKGIVGDPSNASVTTMLPSATHSLTLAKASSEAFKTAPSLKVVKDSRLVNGVLPSNRERNVRCPPVPEDIRVDLDPRHGTASAGGGDESVASQNRGMTRSVSHSSLEAMCYSPHDALEGFETSSVVSFASTAATHHDLDTRIDMVQSLLSMLGTHDKDDMSRTLLAMSHSKDSCAAMRQSGCLPLLIDLLHGKDFTNMNSRREARARAGLALHNIVFSNVDDRRGRREVRVLRLLEIARAHCDAVQFKGYPVHPCAERWYPPLRNHGPSPAVAALMKLSFEEDHRNAICELGGLQAIAELLQIDHQVNERCKDFYSTSLRKYAGMTLTNLTFGNTKNKNVLCSFPAAIDAIVAQLQTIEEEEIIQVSASVLRNLSWRAEELCRKTLRDAGAINALLSAAQAVHGEPALRTTLSALWNLSAHCSENKAEMCASPGALKFLVKCLNYSSPSGNISVVESSGGILRNLSSHIAVRADYRKTLRDGGCFQVLVSHLRSPSLRVLSNVCGALWNLSARCVEDQEVLWELGAVSLLKSLVKSKNKAISQASAAALRNLMAVKPGSSTDNESVSSRAARHYQSMPANMRSAGSQARIKNETARLQSPTMGQAPASNQTLPMRHVSKQKRDGLVPHKATEGFYPVSQANVVPVTRQDIEAVAAHQKHASSRKKTGSLGSLAHSSSSSNHGTPQEIEPSPSLTRARSDVGPRSLSSKQKKAKARTADSNTTGSGASGDCKHAANFKWPQSNDSLAKHRRQTQKDSIFLTGQPTEKRNHCRSSSDGCAVIPLLSDSYPLHVSQNPKRGDSIKDKTSVISRIRNAVQRNTDATTNGYHHQKNSDSMSLVSPNTAKKLNFWAKGCRDTFEMTDVSSQPRSCQAAQQPSNDGSSPSSSRLHHRNTTQKFKSYRDSDTDPDSDAYSEEERRLFDPTRKPSEFSGVGNAWVEKQKSGVHSPRSADTESVASSTCSCDHVDNIWILRPDSKGSKSGGTCGKCNRRRASKSSEKISDNKPTVVKSRRDSSDSPISSPSIRRVFRKSSSREQKKNTAESPADPSKRGVKVTSL